jgi:hypothetical protein
MRRVIRRGTMQKSALKIKFNDWKRSLRNTKDVETTPTLWTALFFGFGLYDCISPPPGNQISLEHFKNLRKSEIKS